MQQQWIGWARVLLGVLPVFLACVAHGQDDSSDLPLTGKRYADIDFGPSKSMTLEVSEENIAHKGIAIRLDDGPGGVTFGDEFVAFDTDTLRYAGAWTGQGFIDWRGIAMDGAHNAHPSIVGTLLFENRIGPGWARPGTEDFADVRTEGRDGKRYGPLPRDWAHWRGRYVHGGKVVLSYLVGDTEVLESPGAAGGVDTRFMTRTLNIGSRSEPMMLQVAHVEDAVIGRNTGTPNLIRLRTAKARSGDRVAFDGGTVLDVANSEDWMQGDFTIVGRIRTTEGGTILAKAPTSGPWVEDGQTFFVRGGRLCFDIGWVGEITSDTVVANGAWHDVAVTFDAEIGEFRLYVDGAPSGRKRMQPRSHPVGHIARIGYTATDFPNPGFFRGEIEGLRYYARRLTPSEIAGGLLDSGATPVARWDFAQLADGAVPNLEDGDHPAVLGAAAGSAGPQDLLALVDGRAEVEWRYAESGDLRLYIPAGDAPMKLKISLAALDSGEDGAAIESAMREGAAPADLAPLTTGGPTQWTEKLTTRGELGTGDGAYVIDDIREPVENPYRSWLRFSGFDFFADDTRAALSTWNGDVWLVDGIGESLEDLTWQRIASGMFQPLGLKIVEDEIYVLCRDQITILRDLNGDGETDFYENFNNDAQVTEHFHEFALDLQRADNGDFYYTKGARHAADALVPQHGTLMRVAADGSESEIVARGFRAPNGLGITGDGAFIINDNQGHWMPANRINWVEPGGFYGYMQGYHDRDVGDGFDPPLCWVHPSMDRSPGTTVWPPDFRWGPLAGRMITISYGMGQIFHILHEEVDGVHQGGVVRFPLDFETGVMRAKFRPRDGQLYLAGLFGWAGNKTRPGGFYRVRYTGARLYMPEELHAAKDGIVLRFTDPLDPESAVDLGNYAISHWKYAWTRNYGSPDLKMDGSEGRDSLRADWASLSRDGKTVYLRVPGIRPVMQMQVMVNLRAADGAAVRHRIQNTIHKLGAEGVQLLAGVQVSASSESETVLDTELEPGLVQTLAAGDGTDTRAARMAALYVAEGTPATPFLEAGSFTSQWRGYLRADLNSTVRFSVEGNGEAACEVNGASVLDAGLTALRQGLNPITVNYTAPASGPAEFRLYWESEDGVRAPVPPSAFARARDTPALARGESLRDARATIIESRCANCHSTPDVPVNMGPNFDDAKERFGLSWLRQWVASPRTLRPDTAMPHLLNSGGEDGQAQAAADIAVYLAGRGAHALVDSNADISAGEALFGELGCVACHRFESESAAGDWHGRMVFQDLAWKWKPEGLLRFLEAPEASHSNTKMPNFGLSREEAAALSTYLRAESSTELNLSQPWLTGSAERGARLVAERGCLNCHEISGREATLTAAPLTSITKLDSGCLSNAPFAEYGFDAETKALLRSFLAEAPTSLTRETPAEYAERQIDALQCTACHARDGAEDLWSRLAPKAKEAAADADAFFGEDEAATIHLGRPPLDLAGEKLHSAWMARLLAGALDYKTRPQLPARMPAFPAYADALAEGIAAQHGYAPGAASAAPVDAGLAAQGRALALDADAFRCNTCHGVGAELPLAGADTETINFAYIPERLRRDYYHRFVRDPQALLPGTQMPKYVDAEGKSTIPDVLNGDAQRQFEAIWEFMRAIAID